MLPQGLGDALGDPTVLLAGDQHRVEDRAAIVDGNVAEQGDFTGVGVDLHHGDVGPERVRRVEAVEVQFVGKTALEALASAAKPAEKMEHGDEEEEKGDAEKADAASDDEARKMEHGDEEKKEDEEKAEKADPAPEASAPADLSDIKVLLESLQAKLAPLEETKKAQEDAIAKGLAALTERLDRMNARVEAVEKARGLSRGEGDTVTEVAKGSSSIFAGLI